MVGQIKIKKVVTIIFIFFVIITGNIQRQASAHTVDPAKPILAPEPKSKEYFKVPDLADKDVSSDAWISGKEFNETKRYLSYNTDENRSRENHLAQGNFHQIELEPSEEFSHLSEESDDRYQIPSPDPVPLPSSVLLLGTGLAVLAGISGRKSIFKI